MSGISTIDEIKHRHRLEQLLPQYYAIPLKRSGKDQYECNCPFHDDKTPSLKITPSKQLWNCFGCNAGGDIIRFVEMIESVDTKTAIKRLSNGHFTDEPAKTVARRTTIIKDVTRIYANSFKTVKPAHAYLESRGITDIDIWNHFDIGYCDGGTLKRAVQPESIEQLKSMGVLNDKGNESFYKCITIPIKTERGIPVGLYGRSIDGDRHHYLKSDSNEKRKGVFNGMAAKNHDDLIICESVFDALSLIQMNYLNVICIWGCQSWTEDHDSFIKNNNFKEIIFALDNDDTGRKTTERLKNVVHEYVGNISTIELPENIKDINDFIANGGERKDFQELLNRRIFLAEEEQEQDEEVVEPIEKSKESVTFKFEDLYYQVKPVKSASLDVLKAVITIYTTGNKYTDSVNLYSARARTTFATAASNKLYVQAAKCEDDLYKVIAYIEHMRLKELEKRNNKDEAPRITERDKKEAIEFLKSKHLVRTILSDIEAIGYAGQTKEVMLLYTSFLSVLGDSQIHVSIQSSSSSGKSEMLLKVSSLLPPERVQLLSRMSSQSLYYGTSLDGTVMILDERSAADDQGQLALRSVMSRGKLSLNVVQRDPLTGQSKTESIHVSAKCCVWDADTDTTTEDNLNRAFQVYMDLSTEQTKRIHSLQTNKFSPENWGKDLSLDLIKRKHHNAIRLLKPYKVEIPYSKHIRFPVHNMRSRRDFFRFLNLISCVTLLHQYQRPILRTRDGIEYIQATLSDYECAYKMIVDIVRDTYSPIQKESNDLLHIIRNKVLKLSEESKIDSCEYAFTRREVREWSNWSEWKTRRCLRELIEFELIQRIIGRNGSLFKYRLMSSAEENFKDGTSDLTTPENLKQVINDDLVRTL